MVKSAPRYFMPIALKNGMYHPNNLNQCGKKITNKELHRAFIVYHLNYLSGIGNACDPLLTTMHESDCSCKNNANLRKIHVGFVDAAPNNAD